MERELAADRRAAIRYLTVLALVCGLVVAALGALSTTMQAFTGSGTRLGGFPESDYGWRAPQAAFSRPAFRRLGSLDEYTAHADVIVIGDSFSEDRWSGWVNHFAYAERLAAVVFHIDRIALDDLLNHPVYRADPPRYVLVTSNEGLAFARFARLAALDFERPDDAAASTVRTPRRIAHPAAPETFRRERETAMTFRDRMAATGDYVKKALQRAVLGPSSLPVLAVPLDCDTCFSHARNDRVLVMRSTLRPAPYPEATIERGIHGLERVRAAVERDGRTTFRSTVFPSKLNVYRDYIAVDAGPSLIDPRLATRDTGFVDLMPALRAGVRAGTTDVYLPNDHHMGAAGYAIAASVLRESLTRRR